MVNMPPMSAESGGTAGDGGGGGRSGSPDNMFGSQAAPTSSSSPPPPSTAAPTTATNSNGTSSNKPWGAMMGGMAGSLVTSARGVVSNVTATAATATQSSGTSNNEGSSSNNDSTTNSNELNANNANNTNPAPSSGGNAFFSNLTSNITSSVSTLNTNVTNATTSLSTNLSTNLGSNLDKLQPLQSFTKSLSNNITGKNTLPDKTTASQVLMFRQLLHTKCRPGLRLSRNYEGTAAQKAVLHMPWWERGIEQSKKMIISYDNLITRLWLSGAIMPFEKGGYASVGDESITESGKAAAPSLGAIDTLINERGLPPVPHSYWVDRLGFQQDDPVTDFRSGGVLSLAMLVQIVESCPAVHSRFVPKPKAELRSSPADSSDDNILSLEEIITDDASVLPFGITCINITDMLAKFLMFSKAVDKMDALLSAKPFWKMCIDPNAILVLQEVSLDLLCDVCVEIGRERRVKKLVDRENKMNGTDEGKRDSGGMPGTQDGKVTVFDFSEIMERTEKRVGDEVLGAGPQSVDELRAIARRVKSKYLMRIQLKEKHLVNPTASSPLGKQIPPMPSKESMKNVTSSVIGGVGGFVNMLKRGDSTTKGSETATYEEGGSSTDVIDFGTAKDATNAKTAAPETPGGQEAEVNLDGTTSTPDEDLLGAPTSPANPFASGAAATNATITNETAASEEPIDELDKLSAELGELSTEAFDFLGDDFDTSDLDALDTKVDSMAAFAIDDDDFLS